MFQTLARGVSRGLWVDQYRIAKHKKTLTSGKPPAHPFRFSIFQTPARRVCGSITTEPQSKPPTPLSERTPSCELITRRANPPARSFRPPHEGVCENPRVCELIRIESQTSIAEKPPSPATWEKFHTLSQSQSKCRANFNLRQTSKLILSKRIPRPDLMKIQGFVG